MSDKKQFAIVMLIASFFVIWIVYSNMSIIFINNKIMEDPELSAYPYSFRILRKDGNTAVMGSLRSAEIPVSTALKIMFPELEGQPDNSRFMYHEQHEMAKLQARAQEIVLKNSNFDHVRWELDENWFRLHSIIPMKP